jgi:toxin ParE1/3/4
VAGYLLTNAASNDIAAIFMQSLAQFGQAQADKYYAGLDAAFEFLAEFPRATRLREEIDPPVRAFRYRSHVVVYDLGEANTVIVLRVRHCREDWIHYADEN